MEKLNKKQVMQYSIWGMVTGLLNGLFGSGGGVMAVIVLKRIFKLETHKAHATAILVILPLSVLSIIIDLQKGGFPFGLGIWVSVGGVVGGIIGAKLLSKLSSVWVTRIFAILMLAAAVRMFFA